MSSKALEREQRKNFDKMTSFETIDEVFMMVVSGLAPIDKTFYMETLVEEELKKDWPKIKKREHDSNSSHGSE